MRPIDVIRGKIDSDLLKYHTGTLCEIIKIKDIKASGLTAVVRKIVTYDGADPNAKSSSSEDFIAIITNSQFTSGTHNDIKTKFSVLVMNMSPDNGKSCSGLLVPRSVLIDKEYIDNEELEVKKRNLTQDGSLIS